MSFSPTDLSGLMMWFDADSASDITASSGRVTQWTARYTPLGGSKPTLSLMNKSDFNLLNVSTNIYTATTASGYNADSDGNVAYLANERVYTGPTATTRYSQINGIEATPANLSSFNNDISQNTLNSKKILTFTNAMMRFTNLNQTSLFKKSRNTTFTYSATYLLKKNATNKAYIFNTTDGIINNTNSNSLFGNNNNTLTVSRNGTSTSVDTFNSLNNDWMIYTVLFNNIITNNNIITSKRQYYLNGINVGSYDVSNNILEPFDFMVNSNTHRAYIGNFTRSNVNYPTQSASSNIRLSSGITTLNDGRVFTSGTSTTYTNGVNTTNSSNVYNYTLDGFNGSIAEIVIYNEYKTPDDLRKVNDYLLGKWGSTILGALPTTPPAISQLVFFDNKTLQENIDQSIKQLFLTSNIQIFNGETQITDIANIIHGTTYNVRYQITTAVSGNFNVLIKKVKGSVPYTFITSTSANPSFSHTASDGTASDLSYNWYYDASSTVISTAANPTITPQSSIITTINPTISYKDPNYGTFSYELSPTYIVKYGQLLNPSGIVKYDNTYTYSVTSLVPFVGLSYQWLKDGVAIAGQTTATLTDPNCINEADYTLQITYNGSTYTTNANHLYIINPPSFTFVNGRAALNTVSVSGCTYRWVYNNAIIASATTSRYFITDETKTGLYNAVITYGSTSLSSDISANFAGYAFKDISATDSISFTKPATPTFIEPYIWYKNQTSLGVTTSTYNKTGIVPSDSGVYTIGITRGSSVYHVVGFLVDAMSPVYIDVSSVRVNSVNGTIDIKAPVISGATYEWFAELDNVSFVANPYTFKKSLSGAGEIGTTTYTFNSTSPGTTVASVIESDGTYTIRSSNSFDSGFNGANVLDTDGFSASSDWAIRGTNFQVGNSWWSLQFPYAVKINRIDIGTRNSDLGQSIANYKIQGSNDNNTWTDLTEVVNQKAATVATVFTVNIPSTNQNLYTYYRIFLTSAAGGTTKVAGSTNTYTLEGSRDVGMAYCKFYKTYGSLTTLTGFTGTTTNTLTAQIWNGTVLNTGKFYVKINKNGVSITTKIPATFIYNLLNEGSTFPLLNTIDNSVLGSFANYWYLNKAQLSSSSSIRLMSPAIQYGTGAPNIYVNTVELTDSSYNQYVAIVDKISTVPSFVNAANTSNTFTVKDISQSTFTWYKGTTALTGETSSATASGRSTAQTEKNNYYALVKKYGLTRYTNIATNSLPAPLQVTNTVPAPISYTIVQNTGLTNGTYTNPLSIYTTTTDGRLIFVDSAATPNYFVTVENYLSSNNSAPTLYQIPYPSATSTFTINQWNTVQVATYLGVTRAVVKCKETSGGAQFLQAYTLPMSTDTNPRVTLGSKFGYGTIIGRLTEDNDTERSTCHTYSGNGRYIFWKVTNAAIYLYDITSPISTGGNGETSPYATISYTGAVRSISTTYDATLLCLTLTGETSSTAGYKIVKSTGDLSTWTDTTALYSATNTNSMTYQISNKISNRTSANGTTNVTSFTPATLPYSIASTTDMSTIFLYVPNVITGSNRGVMNVFDYANQTPTLKYFFYPQVANSLTYFSTNSEAPYFINGPHVYKIPNFYLSKMSTTTGLDTSGTDLSPIVQIRNKLDISNNMPVPGNTFSTRSASMISTDGSKVILYSASYQVPGVATAVGGFSLYEIGNVVPTITQPSSITSYSQLERTSQLVERSIKTDFLNNTYQDTANTYLFVQPTNNQGSIYKIRNNARNSSTLTYTTNTAQGKVGDWRVRVDGITQYPLSTSSWYSLKVDISRGYYFSVDPGVNFENINSFDKNASDTPIALQYFVDPEVVAVASDISNAVVNFPMSTYLNSKTKASATASISQVTQQPDSLNTQPRVGQSAINIASQSALYDASGSRIIYKGYPSILKNSLIKLDTRYTFDTDDLIRWFNPSISKEYDVTSAPYEYGWAIRITRGSATIANSTSITWGWQVSADGGTNWKTLANLTGTETYFFKNTVPGTTFKYKFRYVDVPGSTQLTAAVSIKYLTDFLVLPWNEENEDIATATIIRDERDYSTGSSQSAAKQNNFSTPFTHYIGRLQDGSGNNVGNNGRFSTNAGIVRVDISGASKPILRNRGPYNMPFTIVDNMTDPSGMTISELFYGTGSNKLFNISHDVTRMDVDIVDPDISSNQLVLGLVIDLSSVNVGDRGTWQYKDDGIGWKNMVSNTKNTLILWSSSTNDAKNLIRFLPNSSRRTTDSYETLTFYIYDGSDVQTDHTCTIIPNATLANNNKNGSVTNELSTLRTSNLISDASGTIQVMVEKFNSPPELKNTADYTIEYKYNRPTYMANGLVVDMNSANTINIPISDLTNFYNPCDIDFNNISVAIGDISNVPLTVGESDVSNNYYGPYNLGSAAYKLDISNGNYASIADSGTKPIYSVTDVANYSTNLSFWLDGYTYSGKLLDANKGLVRVDNKHTDTGKYLSQTNEKNRPTYTIDEMGYKGFRFNGSNQWLDICGSLPINSTSHIFMVVERRAAGGRAPFLGTDSTSAADFSNIEFGYAANDASGVIFSADGTTTTPTARVCSAPGSINAFSRANLEPIRIWTYQYDNQTNSATKNVTIYLNNQVVSRTSVTAAATGTQFTGLTKPTLGRAQKGSQAYYYNGIIYEALYYSSTTTVLASIQESLMQKYGLLDKRSILSNTLQAWYDFSVPKDITYDTDSYVVTAVKNQYKSMSGLTLTSGTGPSFALGNLVDNSTILLDGSDSFNLSQDLIKYFTGQNIIKSYTLIVVEKRDDTFASQASGFLGNPSSSQFYIGYDSSQNMVVRVGSNQLTVSAINITYIPTRIWTFTYNASTNNYEIFMNNYKMGTKVMGALTSWTDDTVFGKNYYGSICEIALYNSVLPYTTTYVGAANIILTNLYSKWLVPYNNSAQTELLRCFAWYDSTDTTLFDLSGTAVSTVYNKYLLENRYTLTQTTVANKPTYNATEKAIQFTSASSTHLVVNAISNATDTDKSHTILIVEKRAPIINSLGVYSQQNIIGTAINFGYKNGTGLQYNSTDIPNTIVNSSTNDNTVDDRRLWTLCYDGVTKKVKIYLNNELIFMKTDPYASGITWTARFIGAATSTTNFYNGFIYEMMFFNDSNPPFLAELQTSLINKWSIPLTYVSPPSLKCWIDMGDAASYVRDPTNSNITSLYCKQSSTLLFSQATPSKQPTLQFAANQASFLGKNAMYLNGATYMDGADAFTNTLVGGSYTLVFVERRDQTVAKNTFIGSSSATGTGISIYTDVNAGTSRFNYAINGGAVYSFNLIPNYNYVDLPTNIWTITYNATTAKLTVSHNTTRLGSVTVIGHPTSWTAGATLGNSYKGYINELMLFNSASVSPSTIVDIQKRLITKWIVDNIDVYIKYSPVVAWYDMGDSDCIDLSGSASAVYRIKNKNVLNTHMNFVQTTVANCPSVGTGTSISAITFGASKFMNMSPYLRDIMLSSTLANPQAFTIMMVERRLASGVHNFFGDTTSGGLNIGYGVTEAEGIIINTAKLNYADVYGAGDEKKLWTFAFVYNAASDNQLKCNVYLNNIYLGYTTNINRISAWANPCIGRNVATYSNFELYELAFFSDGTIENLSAIQDALIAKHGITSYSVPVLSASNSISITDINTNLVAWYDMADRSTYTIRGSVVTDLSGLSNKITANPTYTIRSGSASAYANIGSTINDLSGMVFTPSRFMQAPELSSLFVNNSYTIIVAERRGTGANNVFIGTLDGKWSMGYGESNGTKFVLTHAPTTGNVTALVDVAANTTDEPVRVWTVAYNNSATTNNLDIYFGNQKASTSTLGKNQTSSTLTFGRNSAAYYTGAIYEVLIYNTYVSDAVLLKKVQERLMTKWQPKLSTATYALPSFYPPSSLVGWFDAAALTDLSGTAVSEIPNKISKYAPYFSMRQTTATARPTVVTRAANGLNMVRFNRSAAQYMDLVNNSTYSADTNTRFTNLIKGSYTLMIVETPTASSAGTVNPFIGGRDLSGTTGNNYVFGYNSDTSGILISNKNAAITGLTAGVAANSKVFLNAYTPGTTGPRLWTLRHTNGGATYSLSLNGRVVESVTGGSLTAVANFAGLAFGRYITSVSTNYYSGDFGEMMLFNTDAVPDIDKYHKYLIDKWGITAGIDTYYADNNGLVAWFDMNDRSTMSSGSSFINRLNNKMTIYPTYFMSNEGGTKTTLPKFVGGAVHSLNALQFNPTNSATQHLKLSPELAKLFLRGEYTLMVVEKRTDMNNNKPFFGGSSTGTNNVAIGYGTVTANTNQTFNFTTGTSYSATTSLNFSNAVTESPRLWTFEMSSSKMIMYHNGIPFYSTGSAFAPSARWLDPYLGRNGSNYYNGYICEIMLFKTSTLINRSSYENYLYKKWIANDGLIDQYKLITTYPTGFTGFAIDRWFDFSDKNTINSVNGRVTNITQKFIQNTGARYQNTTSTGPKYLENALGGRSVIDFSGNTLAQTADNSSSDGDTRMIILVERPSIAASNTVINTATNQNINRGSFSYTNTTVNATWSHGASGSTSRTYNGINELPHIWVWVGTCYNNPNFGSYGSQSCLVRYDGTNIISIAPDGSNEGYQKPPKLDFSTGYFGSLCEVITFTVNTNSNTGPHSYDITNIATLNTFIANLEKFLLKKWSSSPSITIPINENRSQSIIMNIAAWDLYKTSQKLPLNRTINSAYSNELAKLKIYIYNQNRSPSLIMDPPGSYTRTFDLTTVPSVSNPIGVYDNKYKDLKTQDQPGYIDIPIDSLFQSSLLNYYVDTDSRDSRGIAIVGLDKSKGTWYLYKSLDAKRDLNVANGSDLSIANALFVKQKTGYFLRHEVSSSFIKNPSEIYFDVIAWDSTDDKYKELDYADLTEETWASSFSYSDPAYTYRYKVRSRPFIESNTRFTFTIQFDTKSVDTKTVVSNEYTIADLSSNLVISSPLNNGINTLYITNFRCTTGTSILGLEYKNPSGLWVDLSASDTNPILATYPVRMKSNTITETDIIDKEFEFSIKVHDSNVGLISSNAATVRMTITEINVAPTLKYINPVTNAEELNHEFDKIYNNITADYPYIDLEENFVWNDNNFSQRLKQKTYAISVINSVNGIWYHIDPDNNKEVSISSMNEGQLKLVSALSKFRYVPSRSSNGIAILNIYAWDRGKDTDINTIISLSPGKTTYDIGLFSEQPVVISIPVQSPNNAPRFESSTKTVFKYDLAEQTDDNTNTIGDSVFSIIDVIIGTDYRDTFLAGQPENKGLAVIGMTRDATVGVWQYSINAGAATPSWIDMSGTYSDNRALVLASTVDTAIRFKVTKTSNYANTYSAPTLSVRAWDQTDLYESGTDAVVISATGETAPYSTQTATLSCPIRHINHPPQLGATNITLRRTVKADAPHVIDISSIIQELGANYIEKDVEQTVRGFAIIDISNVITRDTAILLGTWKISNSEGLNDLNIGTNPVTITNETTDVISFIPAVYAIGKSTLRIRLYDGDYSTDTFNYELTVLDVNYAPYFAEGAIAEKGYSGILFSGSLDVNVSTLVADLSGADFNGDSLGVVLYDNFGTSMYNRLIGLISYKTKASDPAFINIGASTLQGGAVHIPNTGIIRYTPARNQEGLQNAINVLLWDQTNASSLVTGTSAVTARGVYTAYSTDAAKITFNTAKRNYAPEIASTTIDLETLTDIATTNTYSVSALINNGQLNYVDSNIPQDPENTYRGIAIYTQDVYGGVWEYSLNGTTWTTINASASAALHFREIDTTLIRYRSTMNVTDYATLSVYGWDSTDYSVNVWPRVAAVPASASRGGSTPYSANSASYRVNVEHRNRRPEFNSSSIGVNLGAVDGYSVTNSVTWIRVGDISGIFGNLTDPDSALQKRGSVLEKANLQFGIIIHEADNTKGTWYYSTTNQTTSNSVPIVASLSSGIVLSKDVYIRFEPKYNRDIGDIVLRCKGIESNGSVILRGGKDTSVNDLYGDYTVDSVTLTTAIRHINKAPVLEASQTSAPVYTFPEIYGDDIDNAESVGVSTQEIMDSAAFRAVYSDPDINDNVATSDQKGLVISSRGGNASGSWQYKMSAIDVSWNTIGSTVTATTGLPLPYSEDVRIRFIPSLNADASANFTFYAWDKTTGTAGSLIDIVANKGDPYSISNNPRLMGVSMRYLNHRPSFAKSTTDALITPGNNDGNDGTTLRSIFDASGLSFTERDIADGKGLGIVGYSIPADLSGAWQSREGVGSWSNITLTSDVYLIKQSGTTQIRFYCYANPATNQTATLTVKAWDTSEFTSGTSVSPSTFAASTSSSTATSTIVFNVDHIEYAPDVGGDITYSPSIRADNQIVSGQAFTGASLSAILDLYNISGTNRAMVIVSAPTSGRGSWSYKIGTGAVTTLTIGSNQGIILREQDNVNIGYFNNYPSVNTFYTPSLLFYLMDLTIYQNVVGSPVSSGQVLTSFSSIPKGGVNYISANNATFKLSIIQVSAPPLIVKPSAVPGKRRVF